MERLTNTVELAFPGLPNARWVALRLLDGDARIGQAVRAAELGNLSQDQSTGSQTEPDESAMSELGNRVLALASSLRWEVGPRFHERLAEAIYTEAARIADACTTRGELPLADTVDRKLDRLFTGKWTGLAVMLAMLAGVLWLTIIGANYPSGVLAWLLVEHVYPMLKSGAAAIGMPLWLSGVLIGRCVSGNRLGRRGDAPSHGDLLPTVHAIGGLRLPAARGIPNPSTACSAVAEHTENSPSPLCMGLGCNAAGVIATRIIDSPRERLIAIITNNFALCNGRWPTQILIAAIFVGALVPAYLAGVVSALAVLAVALLGVGLTFLVSWGLSRTVLRGQASLFSLEMPPFPPPADFSDTLYVTRRPHPVRPMAGHRLRRSGRRGYFGSLRTSPSAARASRSTSSGGSIRLPSTWVLNGDYPARLRGCHSGQRDRHPHGPDAHGPDHRHERRRRTGRRRHVRIVRRLRPPNRF